MSYESGYSMASPVSVLSISKDGVTLGDDLKLTDFAITTP